MPKTTTALPAKNTPPVSQCDIHQAIALYAANRWTESLALAKQLLSVRATDVHVLNLAAACSLHLERQIEAEQYWTTAIACRPDYAEAHYNLGTLFQAQKRFIEAENAYRQTLAISPGHPDAHNNLGNLLQAQKRFAEAESAYRQTLSIRPEYPGTHNNLGTLLQEQQRFDEAENAYRQALTFAPDVPETHYNLGNLFKKQNRVDEAEGAYRRAIAIRPDYPDAYNNLGNLLKGQKRFAEAERAYRQVLAIRPNHHDAYNNLGNLFKEQKRFAEAERAFRGALAIRPGYPEAAWNLGLLFLSTGRLPEGWPLYEIRNHPDKKGHAVAPPNYPFPQWQGESLRGRSILIQGEQGFGDEIQFVRYLPLLRTLGAERISLVGKPALHALFRTVAGIDAILLPEEAKDAPAHDFWAYLLSLPRHFATTLETIPARLPYLAADSERMRLWQSRLPAQGLRVGLVWKGSALHKNDANRSLPGLHALAPLWTIPDIRFVSLQKGQGEEEAQTPPADQAILHLGSDIRDFADSAAIVAQLDLVICVDTAIAHLCGALGKPCWVLLPGFDVDWRWLQERPDSPWYPATIRLFRQHQEAADWSPLIDKVARELAEFALHNRSTANPGNQPQTTRQSAAEPLLDA